MFDHLLQQRCHIVRGLANIAALSDEVEGYYDLGYFSYNKLVQYRKELERRTDFFTPPPVGIEFDDGFFEDFDDGNFVIEN